ncbi:MAG: hypothetical protein SP4CHLAM5_11110 [Chlamydiia bacterium]|nr:hypothetical protein [Chlamydiia bacterium]MCH9618968.1 hypothetical protein [Chlamydiia bacterium]MCH9624772.1 hypothetical protein [Chlamydiia bacterium]
MIVYSEKMISFITEIKNALKEILVGEAYLKVRGDRFYNKNQTHSFPIKIVIFNHQSKLGYFDPNFYELGFHRSAFSCEKEKLHNLIRHELAHYLTYIKYGDVEHAHGAQFRSICKELNWGKEIYGASMAFDAPPLEKKSLSRKIEKLMALGTSANIHEASGAIIKARELLIKHNLDLSTESDDEIFLRRILKQKRKNAKMEAIAHILETFFVSTVYNHGKDFIYLEILGSAVNVEIAEYISSILDYKLDNLWAKAGLKGLSEKNSFFYGIAKGYCEKVEALKEQQIETSCSLMIIEKKLETAKAMAYGRLRASRSQRKLSPAAALLGKKIGKKLRFKQGVNTSTKTIKQIT